MDHYKIEVVANVCYGCKTTYECFLWINSTVIWASKDYSIDNISLLKNDILQEINKYGIKVDLTSYYPTMWKCIRQQIEEGRTVDDYKLYVENIAHNCEFCGHNTDFIAEIYLDNKMIWRSRSYCEPDDKEIEEFRKEITNKLKEIGIERDLSDSSPYFWSDD